MSSALQYYKLKQQAVQELVKDLKATFGDKVLFVVGDCRSGATTGE